DLHSRRVRSGAVPQTDVLAARTRGRPHLSLPLLDLRSAHWRHGDLRAGRTALAAVAADGRLERLPAGSRKFLRPGRTRLVECEGAANHVSDSLEDPVRFIDQRTASAPLLRKALRYL